MFRRALYGVVATGLTASLLSACNPDPAPAYPGPMNTNVHVSWDPSSGSRTTVATANGPDREVHNDATIRVVTINKQRFLKLVLRPGETVYSGGANYNDGTKTVGNSLDRFWRGNFLLGLDAAVFFSDKHSGPLTVQSVFVEINNPLMR